MPDYQDSSPTQAHRYAGPISSNEGKPPRSALQIVSPAVLLERSICMPTRASLGSAARRTRHDTAESIADEID